MKTNILSFILLISLVSSQTRKYTYTMPFEFTQDAILDIELNLSKILIVAVFIILFLYYIFDFARSYICSSRNLLSSSMNDMFSDDPELLID